MKNILFRLNAGGKFGLGHYYRSIALAGLLKAEGYNIFIVHNDQPFWSGISMSDNRFNYLVSEDDSGLNTVQILKIVSDQSINVVFNDGNIEYEKTLWEELGMRNIRVINYQNLGGARQLCDVYILPSIHQDNAFFSSFEKIRTRIYKGLKYFTFNEKVLHYPRHRPSGSIKLIAVTTGGSDPMNMTGLLYDFFRKMDNFNFIFFIGESFMHDNQLKTWDSPHIKVEKYDIPRILEADVLISAFGVSTYEFMALGMPIISIGHQESNAQAATYLAQTTGAILSLGEMSCLTYSSVEKAIEELALDNDRVNSLISASNKIIDLGGNTRVKQIIQGE